MIIQPVPGAEFKAMSGTPRILPDGRAAFWYVGLLNVAENPPPVALLLELSSHTTSCVCEVQVLLGLVSFVPPTAVTHGELHGKSAIALLSPSLPPASPLATKMLHP